MSLTAQTVTNYYEGILRQEPTAAQVASYQSLYQTTTQLTDALLGTANVQVDPVVRLYQAAFNRVPESDGLTYWVNQYTVNGGTQTLGNMALGFSLSDEFQEDYSGFLDVDDYRGYVSALYVNVLGRKGDTAGIEYWTARMEAGLSASDVLLNFSEEPEFEATVGDAVDNYLTQCGQYQNGDIATPPYSGTIWDFGSFGATYTLTTGVDTFTGTTYNDTFNAALDAGLNTLNPLDSLNGAGGTDTLNAVVATAVTPAALTNIEVLNATFTANVALGLVNAAQLTNVNNVGSTAAGTFNSIVADAELGVNGTDQNTTFNFATVAGVQEANLTLTNVTGGTETIAGIETINVNSAGYENTAVLTAAAATTVNITGSADLTLTTTGTTSASLWDASTATGNVDLTVVAQTGVAATTDVSVYGGDGDDVLDTTLVTGQDQYILSGAGDDAIINNAVSAGDTIDGGTGTNTLVTLAAAADVIDAAARTTFTNLQELEITDEYAAGGTSTLNLVNIATSINTVSFSEASAVAGTDITGNDVTVTGGAGTLTVNLGGDAAGNTAQLEGILTLGDTGTATTDSVVINNLAVNTTTNVNYSLWADVTDDIVTTGYENVTFNTGSANGTGITQTFDDILITADSASANTSVTFAGTNAVNINDINVQTGAGTGLLTVDASGLSAQAAGTATLTIDGLVLGATGTVSLTGSAGEDVVTVAGNNSSATLIGGEGNDSLVGGTAADSLHGGAGVDTLTGSGGNDTIVGDAGADIISQIVAGATSIDGGAGNDTITLGLTLTSTDTINGGADYDTLSLSVVTASAVSAAAGAVVTNVEALSFNGAGALTQSAAVFSNTTIDTVIDARANASALSITNASSSLNTFALNSAATAFTDSFARATDTSADSLTVRADAAVGAGASLTASNEETITIAAQTYAVDLDLLTSTDLVTLNVTGSGAGAIVIDAAAATALATVDASGLTGTHTLNVDGTDSTTAITFVGGAYTGNTTISGGTGADVFTAGTGALYANGNGGNDSLTGGAGADSLSGGIGADTLVGGTGTDSLLGGVGIDTFIVNGANVVQDLGVNNQADILVVGADGTATVAVTGNWTATSASQNNGDAVTDAALTMGAAVTTVDLSNVTGTTGWSVTAGAAATAVTGSDYDDVLDVSGTLAAANTVTGGVGVDTITTDSTATVVNYDIAGLTVADQTGYATQAALDVVIGFTSGGDSLALGVAGLATGGANVTNYAEVANAAYANYAAILAAGNTSLAATAGTTTSTVAYAFVGDTTSGDGFLFIDTDLNGVADAGIQLTGVLSGDIALTDIVA